MTKTIKLTCGLLLGALLQSTPSHALSPPNPTADIPWNAGDAAPDSVESVEIAFTQARRTEETQHTIAAHTLGNLELPSQPEWDAMTPAAKALMITNAERTARHGVHYPKHGKVMGLPLEAVEPHLNELAQAYADYMVAQDFWDHRPTASISAPPFAGSDPFTRIKDHAVIGGCRQFLPYAENLYVTATSEANAPAPKTLIESAIYNWLYADEGSTWGHRVTMLIQDQTLDGGSGFNNDRGSAASEGFMGIGYAGKGDGSYTVFDGSKFPSQWNVVWLVVDPVPDTRCDFMAPAIKQ